MKRIGALVPATMVILVAAALPAIGATDDEQTILNLEKQWSAANARGDVSTLERILADDYLEIEAVGEINTKAQSLSDIRSGALVVDAEVPTQMKVRLYGNVAVVTGHLSVRDRRGGKAGHHEVAFTDVWVKKQGRWQVVNYQGTLLTNSTSQ